MTREEAVILSAYTGYLLVDDFNAVHDFIEKLLGRTVWTHQLADPVLLKEIREKCKPILPTVTEKKPLNDTDAGQSMSMSIEEAIKRINQHMSIHYIGQYPHIHIAEALHMALDALREKEERENPQPLTIEELRQMNGSPVWVEELSKLRDNTGWALVDVDDRGTWKGVPFVKCHVCTWNVISRNLHCYRHKPKEG